MTVRLSAVCGQVENATIVRDGEFSSLGFTTSRNQKPLRLLFLDDERAVDQILSSVEFSCLIVSTSLWPRVSKCPATVGVCIADEPRWVFFSIHNYLSRHTGFYDSSKRVGRRGSYRAHPTAIIDDEAIIGDGVTIGPYSVISGRTTIEDEVDVGPFCALGGYGFQYARGVKGLLYVDHVGELVIHPRVHMRSHVCIDIPVLDEETSVGEDTKIDSFVKIGHGSSIGARCLVGAHAVLTGNVYVDDDVWISAGTTVRNRVTLGSNSKTSLGAVVTQDTERHSHVSGNFAIPHDVFIENLKSSANRSSHESEKHRMKE